MTNQFKNGDRISHNKKGLGTVSTNPAASDVVVQPNTPARTPDTVYVIWDDDRFPVGNVPQAELEKVPDAAAAISTGF